MDVELTVAAAVGAAPETCGGPPRPDLRDVFDDLARSEEGSAVERTLEHDERVVAARLPEHGPLVGILYAVRAREPVAPPRGRRLAAIAREVPGELAPVHGDRFAVSGDSSVQGIWSAEHLRRIVTNLATNAAKYGAPDTPVELDVHATDTVATLSVHNAGKPISADELPRLFEPFSRTRSSQHSGLGGWGPGPALAKGRVRAHGGSVSVQSSQRKGTTFTVALPRDARPFQAEATGTRGDSL